MRDVEERRMRPAEFSFCEDHYAFEVREYPQLLRIIGSDNRRFVDRYNSDPDFFD